MLTRDFYESCRRRSMQDSKEELDNYVGGAKTGLNVAWWLITTLNVNQSDRRVLDVLTEAVPDNSTMLFRIRQIVLVKDAPKELLEVNYKDLCGPFGSSTDLDYAMGVIEGYHAAFGVFSEYQIHMPKMSRAQVVKQLETYIVRQRKIMNGFLV